jgi:hypothetical protein
MTIIIAALVGILIVVLAIVFIVVLGDGTGDESTAEVTGYPTLEALAPTATHLAELPPPVIEILPTHTPIPPSPTPMPSPTHTPLPTDIPAPTATNTPVPVIILPTNTPIPLPTDTPAPTSPPQQTYGLVATHWALQDRSVYAVNQPVWFEWVLDNTLGVPVDYGGLGAMPRKDGADRPDLVKISWGGSPGDQIPANGLSADDHILLPEAGNYTLRLVICFDAYETCASGGGTWTTLSHEIPFSIG